MRTALLDVPYATVKAEAADLGIRWTEIPLDDLLVQSYEDGSAVIFVRSGADANRLLDRLLERGFARDPNSKVPRAPSSAGG